jgi:tape measure domain-containing protein
MSVGLTAPLALLGTSLFKSAAQMEQISVSFEVFTGSAETAKNMLAQLKEQALKSPMQFQDITKGAQTLLGYGLTAEQVIPITKMLGDISGGNADKFNRLSLAFGQVNASGRLMGQEVRQMINAGFNPLQSISEKTGESMASLSARMKDGKISVQEVADAFTYATSEGGRFFGNADKQSQTLQGQFNKLQESVNFALAEIGTSLANNGGIKEFFESLTATVTKVKNAFLALSPETQALVLKLGLILATAGPLLIFFGSLFTAIGSISTAVGVLTVAFTGLNLVTGGLLVGLGLFVAAMVGVAQNAREAADSVDNMNKRLKATNDTWNGPDSITESVVFLKNQLKELESRQAFNVKFNPTGIEDTSRKILKLRDDLAALEKNIGKPMPTPGFNTKPPGMDGDTKKSKRFKESFLDFSQEYDTYLKQFIAHKNKLIKVSDDAEAEFDNIGLTGARKKLAILRDNFVKQKAEFIKFGVDTTTITKNYLLKAAQLQGEIEAERQSALLSIIKPLPGMEKNMLGFALDDSQLVKFGEQTQIALSNVQYFADKLKFATLTLGKTMRASIEGMTESVVSGFANMFISIGEGSSAENAIKSFGVGILNSLGDMFIQIGTGIVMASKAMIAVQAFIASMFTGPGVALGLAGGLAMIAVGGLLKGTAGAMAKTKTAGPTSQGGGASMSQRVSGNNYSYGGGSFPTQTLRLLVDLTGAITATQTGYSINKSFETTLRVTGR